MSKFLHVPEFFECVYLVDLSPSLLEIAGKRFERLGWANVVIICQDVREFRLEDHVKQGTQQASDEAIDVESPEPQGADLITLSYSLTMILDFFPVIDLLTVLLSPQGIIGVIDFYVQNTVDLGNRNYTAGVLNRHVNSIGRIFWRAWFEFDHVNLEPARRDYLEYRFGSILNLNCRNWYLGIIPYYIWIGCLQDLASPSSTISEISEDIVDQVQEIANRLSPGSEKIDPGSMEMASSSAFSNALDNIRHDLPLPSFFYQNHHQRLPYADDLEKNSLFSQKHQWTWLAPSNDLQELNITCEDVVLTLTGRGIDAYVAASYRPQRLDILDHNPVQNHLLELEVAAYENLSSNEISTLYSPASKVDDATRRNILFSSLSPHVSSRALQFALLNLGLFKVRGPPSTLGLPTSDWQPEMFHNIRIHTDTLEHHLMETPSASLTVVIVSTILTLCCE